MSRANTKAARLRRDYLRRQREREGTGQLAEDWTCVCGNDIPGHIPICLCGRIRKNEERS